MGKVKSKFVVAKAEGLARIILNPAIGLNSESDVLTIHPHKLCPLVSVRCFPRGFRFKISCALHISPFRPHAKSTNNLLLFQYSNSAELEDLLDDGGSKHLRNFGQFLPGYTAKHLQKQLGKRASKD
jgi:hypothetical protein